MGSLIDVSVIVPVYNAESTIAKCLDSLAVQDSDGLSVETIVVDDGSTDATSGILRAYSVNQKLNLHVEAVENGGPSRARNIGLRLAHGRYVAFCDSDDWFDDGALSGIVSAMKSSDADVGVFGYKNVFNERTRKHAFVKRRVMGGYEFAGAVLLDSRVSGFMWNKLYRRSIVDCVQLDESLNVCEDMDLNIRLALSCPALRVLCIPGTYYNYDLRNVDSLTRGSDRHSDMIRLLETYISVEEIATDAKAAIYQLESKRAFTQSDGLHRDVAHYSYDYWLNPRCPISEKLKMLYRIAASMRNEKTRAAS